MTIGKYISLLASVLLLTGCSKSEFAAGPDVVAVLDSTAICIGVQDIQTTRASGLESFEGSMKVYAAKKMTAGYEKAMGNYAVWNTSANPNVPGEWEYVADAGERKSIVRNSQAATPDNFTVPQKQVKKYWDYKSTEYLFWAVAPYSDNVTFNVSTAAGAANGSVTGATVTGIGGHLLANPGTANSYADYLFARPVRVAKNAYGTHDTNNPVQFVFEHMHAWVRVGIYETISNYSIKDITFYNNDATPKGYSNIIFNRDVAAFVGGNGGTANISYDNSALSYSISYSGLTAQKWIQLGKMYDEGMADPSDYSSSVSYMLKLWGTDGDMNPMTLYFKVLPTPSALAGSTAPITMTLDFTLVSEDSAHEEIRVRGISATVPQAYSTWLPNHAYSYVFKVTQAALDLKKIEFDATASSISTGEATHNEEM